VLVAVSRQVSSVVLVVNVANLSAIYFTQMSNVQLLALEELLSTLFTVNFLCGTANLQFHLHHCRGGMKVWNPESVNITNFVIITAL